MANLAVDGTVTGEGANQIGDAVTDTVGFYGSTPVAQPSGTAQSAVSTGTVTGVTVTSTSIITTGVIAGFQNDGQVTAALGAINALRTAVDAVGSLANALRAALVQTSGLGIIKGSA